MRRHGQMNILHIDDDEDDLEMFESAVHMMNTDCVCHKALNRNEAMNILNSITPDYIFLDVNIPVMNGGQILKALRAMERLRAVPIIMFSTSIHPREMLGFKNDGATHCIIKPSNYAELCEVLKDFFESNATTLSGS